MGLIGIENWGERLKALRISRNLNKNRLSKLSGISHVQLMKYEKGESQPTLSILIKLCQTLGVSMDQLTGFRIETDSEDSAWSNALSEVDSHYQNLPQSSRADLMRCVQSLSNISSRVSVDKLEETVG